MDTPIFDKVYNEAPLKVSKTLVDIYLGKNFPKIRKVTDNKIAAIRKQRLLTVYCVT